MSTPTSIPSLLSTDYVVGAGEQHSETFRAMASTIAVVLGPGSHRPQELSGRVRDVFEMVERECTRFDPASHLMRANAAGQSWCRVGPYCYEAVSEAFRAYEVTGGMFDPRVLEVLRRLGYRGSMPFGVGDLELDDDPDAVGPETVTEWAPRFDADRHAVQVGPHPLDLGGIGKGLAVRWAADCLDADSPSFLLDAGGDCYARGAGPEGGAWQIGIEDPRGGDRPVAVVAITDSACVTSSIRLRHWRARGKSVHHLIDPRTGTPGGTGLLSVTVVGSDPADAEVFSKVLFLHGRDAITAAADRRDDVAALWVEEDGSVGMNDVMRPLVIWQDQS